MAFCCLREWVTNFDNNNSNSIPDIWCASDFISFPYEADPPKLWTGINHFSVSRIGAGGLLLRILSLAVVSRYPVDIISNYRKYLHRSSNFSSHLYFKASGNRSLQPGYRIWLQDFLSHFKHWRSDHRFMLYCCICAQIRPQPAWLGRRLGHVEFKGKVYIQRRW